MCNKKQVHELYESRRQTGEREVKAGLRLSEILEFNTLLSITCSGIFWIEGKKRTGDWRKGNWRLKERRELEIEGKKRTGEDQMENWFVWKGKKGEEECSEKGFGLKK